METLLLDNQSLSIYGSTEMTSDNELRDRIEEIIEAKTYATAPDGCIAGTEEAALAIIDELGLHYVDSEEYAQVGLDWIEIEKGRHVVGKWEKQ